MRVQDHVILSANECAAEFFRCAAAVPAEKLDWKPLDVGQSVISMCREAAMTPTWAVKVMSGWKQTHEDQSALDAEMATWATVAQCHAEFNQKITPWQELIRSFPEERFRETQWLPFNGGREHTYLEMMEFPRWNLTYHLGQIAYIQTLYGDRDMH